MVRNTQTLEAGQSGATTDGVQVRGMTRGRVDVSALSGSLSASVFAVEVTAGGGVWRDFSTTINQSGITSQLDLRGIESVRVRVSTAESSAATTQVTVYAEEVN